VCFSLIVGVRTGCAEIGVAAAACAAAVIEEEVSFSFGRTGLTSVGVFAADAATVAREEVRILIFGRIAGGGVGAAPFAAATVAAAAFFVGFLFAFGAGVSPSAVTAAFGAALGVAAVFGTFGFEAFDFGGGLAGVSESGATGRGGGGEAWLKDWRAAALILSLTMAVWC